jgi:hypothetical protein
MVKRREKTKREELQLSIEIYEKRYQAKDFSGQLLAEYTSAATKQRFTFAMLSPENDVLFSSFLFQPTDQHLHLCIQISIIISIRRIWRRLNTINGIRRHKTTQTSI